jgi:peptide/nickel transport system substrate-binding protein
MIPWLASGPEKFNADYTEITVPIRQGVTWSDGQPFGAEDVAFSVNYVKGNAALAYGAAMETWVKECTAPDPQTVVFKLTKPNPRFIFQNFAIHIWGAVNILPKHIWEKEDPLKFRNWDPAKGLPVWTGPYKVVKASPTEFIYDRRDDWWAAKTGFSPLPAPQRCVCVDATSDQGTRAAMLENNQVDGQPQLNLEPFMKAKEKNPALIGWMEEAPYSWIDPCPWSIKFQCETKPWDDPEMRWALNYSIDKDKLAKTMGGGFGVPARFVFPLYPGIDKFLDDNKDLFEKYPVLKYDPALSKQIFEKKGYKLNKEGIYEKDGQRLSIEILGPTPGTSQIMLSTFWKQVGVDVNMKLTSVAVYHEAVAMSQFQADAGWSYCGSVTDPFAHLDTLHSRWIVPQGERHSGNWSNWKNEEYDKATEAIGMLPAGDERIKPLFRQALELWLRDIPVLALTQQLRIVPYSTKYWTNWPTEKNGYFHPPNWWQCFLQVVLKIKPA